MKKQNGITLIALVITIIVLLILAGVSISLVIGDNGILTQATEAVIENRKATVKEDISMAWAGLEAEYVRNWTTSTSTSKDEFFTVDRFQEALSSKGEITEGSFNFDPETGLTKFKYTAKSDQGKTYSVVVEKDGKVLVDKLAGMITADNYGDYVNYEANNEYSDWKIFYSNGSNVFLIASDYVDRDLVGDQMNKPGIKATYPYSVRWNNVPTALSETARQDTLFGITGNSYKLIADNINSKCASTMLDTANWIEFKDKNGYGEYAIGGPTIEMWIKSWNEKGNKQLKIQNGEYGYYIGPAETENLTTYSYKLENTDKLYFSQTSNVSNCDAYWLASPNNNTSEKNDQYLFRVRYNGEVKDQWYKNSGAKSTAVRPVVALSSEVMGTATTNDDGTITWELSK